MASKYASAKNSIAECDRCGFRYMLKELKRLTIKTKITNIKVCKNCWEPDQPQLSLGMYPVNDPQAVREPRPDVSYYQSGFSGLQLILNPNPTPQSDGTPEGGSRVFQWGWAPVGGARDNDNRLTPNYLVSVGIVSNVTVQNT